MPSTQNRKFKNFEKSYKKFLTAMESKNLNPDANKLESLTFLQKLKVELNLQDNIESVNKRFENEQEKYKAISKEIETYLPALKEKEKVLNESSILVDFYQSQHKDILEKIKNLDVRISNLKNEIEKQPVLSNKLENGFYFKSNKEFWSITESFLQENEKRDELNNQLCLLEDQKIELLSQLKMIGANLTFTKKQLETQKQDRDNFIQNPPSELTKSYSQESKNKLNFPELLKAYVCDFEKIIKEQEESLKSTQRSIFASAKIEPEELKQFKKLLTTVKKVLKLIKSDDDFSLKVSTDLRPKRRIAVC